jgi:uncharacterized protein with PIN domain
VNNKSALFRVYEELNDFLPKKHRKKQFSYNFNGNPSIKDAIEAVGVPHTEIDLILVNSISVGFDHHLQDKDTVSVYPVFEGLDITPIIRLRATPLRESKFIADVHLGKLVRMIRMIGFDTLYNKNYADSEIISIAIADRRIILTRDQNLLKIKTVTHAYWIRSIEPMKQVFEVIHKFDLWSQFKPFTRCLICNTLIQSVNKSEVVNRIPSKTIKYYNEFYECSGCARIYWNGSHYHRMQKKIHMILENRNGKL